MNEEERQNRYVLKRKMFNKYNADEVDAYCSAVHKKIKKLQFENAELVEKVKSLTQKLDDFREKEDSIRNALVTAEKVSDLCIKEAKARAEAIVAQATAESKRVVDSMSYKAIEQKDILFKMRKYVKDYQTRMLLLFKDQLESLKNFMVKEPNYDSLCVDVMGALEQNSEEGIDINSESRTQIPTSEGSKEAVTFESEESEVTNEVPLINEKFKDLKFGDNYPSASEGKKSLFGMFKKVH